MEPDAAEIRVLGCLIEKQRTTPDVYPLTLNALRLACNQSTNRDPVVDYDENTIRSAIERLVQRKWATLASWSNRRSMKYRQTLDQALALSEPEIAVLAVLMLRGAQTPGELKTRTERLHSFGDMSSLMETIEQLSSRDLVTRLDRRPGQREERYRHLLAEGEDAARPGGAQERAPAEVVAHGSGATAEAPAAEAAERVSAERVAVAPAADEPAAAPPGGAAAGDDERIRRIEAQLDELRSEIRALREELGA
jgi:uncharacterized protein